jgi:hypothetical protein
MAKWLWMSCLLVLATTSVAAAQAPAGSAQWSVDGGEVSTLRFHRLHNSKSQKHLFRRSNGELDWKTEEPGFGTAFFDNCTRPGEVVYGSDRVTLRYGQQFLIATGPSGWGWTSERAAGCQYRLIPSGAGFVRAGSGDQKFAIYNMANNRYLVRTDSLVWKEMGGAPGGVVARADFVLNTPLRYTFSNGETQFLLSIKNVGNVSSTVAQQEMSFKFRGRQMVWLLLQPVQPSASVVKVFTVPGKPPPCVLVELDTDPGLKFQMLPGGLPNDFVFLNDRRNLNTRDIRRSAATAEIPCEPVAAQ